MSKCIIEGCTRAIKHPESKLCGPCYQSSWRWGRKTPTQRVKRKQALRVFEARLDHIEPNIAILGRRKK